MKKYIYILVATFACIMFNSCGNSSKTNDSSPKISAERQKFIADSLAKEQARLDAINLEAIEKYKPLFNEETDEFSDFVWVTPKTAPKSVNRNGVYCYFVMYGGKPVTLRFRYQYYADEWLFIESMIFNIDGENITIIPDMDTDCGDGGKIWEWCDEAVVGGNSVDEKFIAKIANAKSVKVKMNGSQYYDTRVLTAEQIKSIKDTYEYYKALGGKFTEI